MDTKYAPAARLKKEDIGKQITYFQNENSVSKFLDAVISPILILNQQRQVVFGNKVLLKMLNLRSVENIFGKRPGEVLNCVHSKLENGGCGTSEYCEYCGAVNSILVGLKGKENSEECSIQQHNGNALDLLVKSTPLNISGDMFVIFAVEDISSKKRRRALERIFFHDVLNTAGGINGFLSIFKDLPEDEKGTFIDVVGDLSEKLIDEIKYQSILSAAENDDLVVSRDAIRTHTFLQKLKSLYSNHEVAKEKSVEIDNHIYDLELSTDEMLLRRVVGNMIKNALEASVAGDTVTIGVIKEGKLIEFWVHNPAFMSRKIQMQVFRRSFTTKGSGRGLGTYSMKLLGERYLGGKVTFSTSELHGTIFKIIIPADK